MITQNLTELGTELSRLKDIGVTNIRVNFYGYKSMEYQSAERASYFLEHSESCDKKIDWCKEIKESELINKLLFDFLTETNSNYTESQQGFLNYITGELVFNLLTDALTISYEVNMGDKGSLTFKRFNS